jgi:peptidoglycan/LPS O-acetylase OafA/YrhL
MFESRHIGWFLLCYLVVQAIPMVVALPSDNFLHYSSLFALGGVALLWQQQRLSVIAYVACLALFTSLIYWQLGIYVAAVGLCTALAVTAMQFRIPVFSFLGKMSYSFYLLHVLIGTTCEFLFVHFISPTTTFNKLLIAFLCLVAATIGSYLFYLAVEKPMMRLASRQR